MLEDGYTYAVSPVIVNLPDSNLGVSVFSLSRQILITNKLDPIKIES
jgi:hypothetical protein